MRIHIEGSDGEEKDIKPTSFEFVSKLILPGLLVLATIVALIKDQRTFAWALIGVLLLSVALGFYSSLKVRLREKMNDRRDVRLLKRALPDFRRFLLRFGDFVDFPTSREETLHNVTLSFVFNQNASEFDRLRMLPVDFFKGYCYHLSQRTSGRRLTCETLPEAISELNMLISDYIRHCIDPVFKRFPQDMRPLLTERAKRELNSFRERFVRFLDDYSEYLKKLEASLKKPRIQGYYLPRPKPL